VRLAILIVALAFIGGLAALTVLDIVHHGLTAVSVLALGIIILFGVGIVGALRHPPAE
jgi:Na+/proline symporter